MILFFEQLNKMISTSQNISKFDSTIKTDILKLYEDLLNGNSFIPTLDENYIELIDSVNLTLVNVFTQLNQTKIVNNIRQKVGYSPAKIATMVTQDPTQALNQIESDYRQTILQLKQIYNIVNEDFYQHKLLRYIFGALSTDYLTTTNLNNYSTTTNSFDFIFNSTITELQSKLQPITIPYLLQYHFLSKLYSRSFKFPADLLSTIYQTGSFSNVQIINEFKQYFTDYNLEITSALCEYIINNIFLFGVDVDSEIETTLRNTISQCLNQFPNLVDETADSFMPSDVVYLLLYNISSCLSTNTTLYYMQNTDVNGDNFYDLIYDFWDITGDDVSYFDLQEDVVLASLQSLLQEKLGTLNNLHLLPMQFATNPLYFLNSYFLAFSRFSNFLVQDTETPILDLETVQTWLNRFFKSKSDTNSKLLNYINTHPLKFTHECVHLPSFLIFRDLSINFCDTDEFLDYLTQTFIPTLMKSINTKYLINVDWYQYIDSFKSFFKTIFMRHLCEKDNNKYKLFGQFTSDLETEITNILPTSQLTLTSSSLSGILATELQNEKLFYSIFHSFYKSAAIAKYTELLLQKSYSL